MSGNESFWDRNIIDGGKWAGDKEMNPKPTQDRVESDNTWRGHGVHNVPNSFDFHCRKVSWQRAKMARWQLHDSGHGGLLTRSGRENFKHHGVLALRHLKKTLGVVHMVQEWWYRSEHFFPAQVIPLFNPNEILVLVGNFILKLINNSLRKYKGN